MNGECFLVERYESDEEEEGEAEQVFLSLTNRFLEERNTQGEVKMLIVSMILGLLPGTMPSFYGITSPLYL